MNIKSSHIIIRCWSAKEGEDEVEGGGGGTLLDVEPGNEQTDKNKKVQANKQTNIVKANKLGMLLDVEPGDEQTKDKQTNKGALYQPLLAHIIPLLMLKALSFF